MGERNKETVLQSSYWECDAVQEGQEMCLGSKERMNNNDVSGFSQGLSPKFM